MASPFAPLPDAIRALLGELDAGWQAEARSDCGACPLARADADGVAYPFSMVADARCCTAQPNLANFLVGRALAEPISADAIRRRIANRDGVSMSGIHAVTGYDDAFPKRAAAGFGRDLDLRCPFWLGGEHACGVWSARSARCRGFFCRHDAGPAGAQAWSHTAGLAVALEAALAEQLVATLGAPAGDAAALDDDALLAWYARCAAAADALTDADARIVIARVPPAVANDADIAARIPSSPRGQLIAKLRRHRPALAERLVPTVSAFQRVGEDILIAGYSTFDAVRAPSAVFELLARLDGATTWRDALAAARAATGDARLDDALVGELRRIGALRDPAGTDDVPDSLT